MRRFFENKMAYAAVVLLFALAFAWNLSHDASPRMPNLLLGDPTVGAHGFALPSTPSTNIRSASGPTMPPPPWEEVFVASGPTMPPPPWEEIG
ncbi:MAG: hypothetical protein C5B51_21455 [Terriglobia bacterium]|nr:MAG: hypothetical protein C5B51_21455 [Terriglobia bacterium]